MDLDEAEAVFPTAADWLESSGGGMGKSLFRKLFLVYAGVLAFVVVALAQAMEPVSGARSWRAKWAS